MSNSGVRRRTAVRAELRGRALRAARRRARAGEGPVRAALRGTTAGHSWIATSRCARWPREMKRLDVADNGLCFGRLDTVSGERSYIGRIGLLDEDERVRTAAARLAGTGGARVLRRHRRQPGEHASAPPVPHPRASRGRFHRRGARPPRRRRAQGDAALLAAVNAPRGDGHARHRGDDPGRAGRDHPARPPRGAGDRGRPGHREDRGGAAPRRLPALHPAGADGTPRRARGRAQPGVPEPHRPRAAVAGRVRRGVHDHRRPRARSARHRRGHPGGRAAQGLAEDPGRARGGGRRSAAAAGGSAADRTGGRHGADRRRDRGVGQGGGTRERAAAQRGPRGVHRDRHVRAHRTGDRPDRPGLADPGGPRRVGAAAGRTCSRSSRTTTRSPPRSTSSGRS